LPVLSSRPGLFTVDATGTGQAVVTNSDGSVNSASNAAVHGSIVTIYATGGGPIAPSLADDQIRGDPPPKLLESVSVFLLNFPEDDEVGFADVVSAAEVAGSVGGDAPN
jgi:uncharacterized protein (TIGR03437 family)